LTTTEGIQQHLQNPLDIKIFNSKTKEVEDISQETVLPLIGKIDLVEKIIENDKVKAIDRESLKKIFKKADLREIIKYFTKDGETAFPAEAIDNDQVNFEKLLKIDNLQEFFKPFFDYCDEKLDNIKDNEMKLSYMKELTSLDEQIAKLENKKKEITEKELELSEKIGVPEIQTLLQRGN
jgi:hypothetical protein